MRTVILYSLLVGLPFLGLLGILRIGDDIVPPRSIGGDWELEAAIPAAAGSPPCPGIAFAGDRSVMHISQSGMRAELIFQDRARTTLSVIFAEDSIRGSGRVAADEACPSAMLVIEGRIVGEVESGGSERMDGTLTWTGCEACPVTAFVATRLAQEGET